VGTAMVLISATAFGTISILAKVAYRVGFDIFQLLAFRFTLATFGMVAVALVLGQNPLALERRLLAKLFALGAVVYTAQALTYFLALRSLPASLCILIVYIYPSLTVIAGWLYLRRAITRWHGIALVSSFAGVVLLLGGARFTLEWALVFAIASPLIYTSYILLGESLMRSAPAAGASAVIFSGTALAFCILAVFTGHFALPPSPVGWLVGVAIAVVPTMVAISLFMAGLPRIGANRAALLSTWEPVVTVLLAVLLLGDRLSGVQVAGGLLVLLAVVTVQAAHLWRPGPQAVLK
jgi:drug/metabolite transporter (DMT)-like permease